MPPKPAAPTKHTRRNEEIRARAKSALRHISLPDPNPLNLTLHGVFARRCDMTAKARDMKWYKLGAKDTTSSVRRFIEGKQDMSFDRLHVIELTCIDIEQEHRHSNSVESYLAQTTHRVRDMDDDVDAEQMTHSFPPDMGLSLRGPFVTPSAPAPAFQFLADDPEIDAMQRVKLALEPLDEGARRRVLEWAADKYNLTVVE